MTIHVYTIVWNDEFMLPHFLKHYEKFADKIFVIDHNSTDKTAEIAKAHPKVIYSKLEVPIYRERLISKTFETYAKENMSDWAVCVDCDEFIQGLETLTPIGSAIPLKTRGYMMIGKTGKLEDCKPVRFAGFDKPVVFDPRQGVVFFDGRHSINLPTKNSKLDLYHYKYISREYYLQRVLNTYPRFGMDAKMMSHLIKKGLAWYDRHI